MVAFAVVVALLALTNRQIGVVSGERETLRKFKASTVSLNDGAPVSTSISLPPLAGATVVKTFNSIAEELHVPLEEVAYSLDTADRTPYLRYRITLTAKSSYAEIRKFLAVLSSEMPNTALDSIRCARPDAAAVTLGCELAFSAFFSRSKHE
jgi:hypothetical protein